MVLWVYGMKCKKQPKCSPYNIFLGLRCIDVNDVILVHLEVLRYLYHPLLYFDLSCQQLTTYLWDFTVQQMFKDLTV